MLKNLLKPSLFSQLSLYLMLTFQQFAIAEEVMTEDAWRVTPAIYLWGAGIDATSKAGKDIEVGFDQLWDNLNLGLMGAFEVRKSKWFAVADVIYLDVSADKDGHLSAPAGPRGQASLNVGLNADMDLEGWVVNLKVGRNIWDSEALFVDVFTGARYLNINSETRINLDSQIQLDSRFGSHVRGSGRNLTLQAGGHVWDAIMGVKGRVTIYQDWFLPLHVDVGTGESDITWQAATGLGYAFEGGSVMLLYRHLAWDLQSGNLIKDIAFSGPMLGAAFHF